MAAAGVVAAAVAVAPKVANWNNKISIKSAWLGLVRLS